MERSSRNFPESYCHSKGDSMKPSSVGRFPAGLLLLLIVIGTVPITFSQPRNIWVLGDSAVPACPPPCDRQSSGLTTGEQIQYLGAYSSDGKFKAPARRSDGNHLRSASSSESSRGWSRPSEVPDSIHLHARERIEENYEPPAHAARPVSGQSILAALRDSLIRFAYGQEPVFLAPHQVTVDARGRILIVDRGAIHVLGNGDSFRIAGGPERRLHSPNGIAVDAANNIYVADSERGIVLVYDPDGKYLRSIGKRGDETLFHYPTAIAIDRPSGRLFVLDSPRHLMFVLDLEGNVLKRIGRRSTHPIGRFSGDTISMDLDYPTEMAIGNNEMVVLDSANSRVQVMDLECQPLAQFKIPVAPGPPAASEVGLSVDPTGRIYVSNTTDSHIRIYSRNGSLLGAFGRTGADIGEFNAPTGLWIDGSNRLYVADTNNARVQVFQLSRENETAAGAEGTR
jgi:DNA-binding beta-propeller fold protein YncE